MAAERKKLVESIFEDPARKLTDAELVEELQGRGHRVKLEKPPSDRRFRRAPKKKKHHRFAVCGDTHLGSRYQQLTHLNSFYDLVVKEGIDTVLHLGDLVHGHHRMHRDQVYELHVHGADAQTQYAVDTYPKRDGVTTLLLTGNHDDSWFSDSGYDVVKGFCERRDDTLYLGSRGAYLEYGGVMIYLWHPRGGLSYARSYRLQKMIEQMSPESKPHILFSGHWHVGAHLPAYRNVDAFLVPCFQSQSPFEKKIGRAHV